MSDALTDKFWGLSPVTVTTAPARSSVSVAAPPVAGSPSPALVKRFHSMADVGRLFSSWNVSARSADSELRTTLKTVRARSRDLCRNQDYGRRFISLLKTNVVGPNGFSFQSKVKNVSGKLDKGANDKIEAGWGRFRRPGMFDVTGCLSEADAVELFVACLAMDGEVLYRRVKGYPDNPCRFAVQFLDPDQLDETYFDVLANGNRVVMGVEINSWGRPVAYHVWSSHPSDVFARDLRRERIPADQLRHVFIVERPGQNRGIPWTISTGTRMQLLAGMEEAHLVACRVAATKMGFYKQQTGAEWQGEKDDRGNFIQDAEPGSFDIIPQGYELQEWDPAFPAQSFDEFMRRTLKGMAAGLNISYPALGCDISDVNYSSLRAGELADRDVYRRIQRLVIENFLLPVFEDWLAMALLTRDLELPVDRYDKYNAPRFYGRGWSWVDPLKDEKANTEALANKTTSRTRILAEQGVDPEEIADELRREEELFGSPVAVKPAKGGAADGTTDPEA